MQGKYLEDISPVCIKVQRAKQKRIEKEKDCVMGHKINIAQGPTYSPQSWLHDVFIPHDLVAGGKGGGG